MKSLVVGLRVPWPLMPKNTISATIARMIHTHPPGNVGLGRRREGRGGGYGWRGGMNQFLRPRNSACRAAQQSLARHTVRIANPEICDYQAGGGVAPLAPRQLEEDRFSILAAEWGCAVGRARNSQQRFLRQTEKMNREMPSRQRLQLARALQQERI